MKRSERLWLASAVLFLFGATIDFGSIDKAAQLFTAWEFTFGVIGMVGFVACP